MYVVAREGGWWEVRESRITPAGPRSRTLASFRELTPEVAERVRVRGGGELEEGELHAAARRAGAPVQPAASDRAAAELIGELAAGRPPRAALARLLAEALGGERDPGAANAQAAVAWIGATPRRRGEALRDLLLLTDRLPRRRPRERERFPRLRSQPA